MDHPDNTLDLPPPEPELDSGWRCMQVRGQWRAQHPIFGSTMDWERQLTAKWAARILEIRYAQAATDAQAAALRHGDAPPAANASYSTLTSLLDRYTSEDERRERTREEHALTQR